MADEVERSPPPASEPTTSTTGRRVRRRDAVAYGLLGAVGLAAAGSTVLYVRNESRRRASDGAAASSQIFAGGGPDEPTWRLWKERGWAREAAYYERAGERVICRLCPNECVLEPGDRGRCRNKVAKEGKLFTMAYGNPCSIHIDPIEKKPLFHFLPGTRTYSLATAGCSLRCLNCQNWEISQKTPEQTKRAVGPELRLTVEHPRPTSREELESASLFPEDLVQIARLTGSRSIAYTYSEPTSYYEYVLDTARLARQVGLKNVLVTNGYLNREPLEQLSQYLDAANVDLKSFSEEIYAKLNSGKLQPVLDGLVQLQQRGVWLEVTNLIVPQHTDDLAVFRRMTEWMVDRLGPDCPLHVSRFHPKYRLDHLPPTPVRVLAQAKQIALEAGLRYVYVGNALGVDDAATTFCPKCRRPVVARDIYLVRSQAIDGGQCRHCGEPIAGVWHG